MLHTSHCLLRIRGNLWMKPHLSYTIACFDSKMRADRWQTQELCASCFHLSKKYLQVSLHLSCSLVKQEEPSLFPSVDNTIDEQLQAKQRVFAWLSSLLKDCLAIISFKGSNFSWDFFFCSVLLLSLSSQCLSYIKHLIFSYLKSFKITMESKISRQNSFNRRIQNSLQKHQNSIISASQKKSHTHSYTYL